MKALPSIAFNDFSGTAKDVTARHFRGRTVLTVRPFPSKVVSSSQSQHRGSAGPGLQGSVGPGPAGVPGAFPVLTARFRDRLPQYLPEEVFSFGTAVYFSPKRFLSIALASFGISVSLLPKTLWTPASSRAKPKRNHRAPQSHWVPG